MKHQLYKRMEVDPSDKALLKKIAHMLTPDYISDEDMEGYLLIACDVLAAVRKHDRVKCASCDHWANGNAYCKRHDKLRRSQ